MTRLPYALVAAGSLALLVVAVAPAAPTLQKLTGSLTINYYKMQLFGVGTLFILAGGIEFLHRRTRGGGA